MSLVAHWDWLSLNSQCICSLKYSRQFYSHRVFLECKLTIESETLKNRIGEYILTSGHCVENENRYWTINIYTHSRKIFAKAILENFIFKCIRILNFFFLHTLIQVSLMEWICWSYEYFRIWNENLFKIVKQMQNKSWYKKSLLDEVKWQ